VEIDLKVCIAFYVYPQFNSYVLTDEVKINPLEKREKREEEGEYIPEMYQ
jgi:hypothetical protein